MISKNQAKIITSLQQKKYRSKHGLFVAEGVKVIQEFLNADFQLERIFTTVPDNFSVSEDKLQKVEEKELKKVSFLKTANKSLALFRIPEITALNDRGLTLVLDDVRDPGNLGTIIRLCDWFGVDQLVCSLNTVDCYNPKVVQATMGSLTRVDVIYTQLEDFLATTKRPVLGTFMDGSNVYKDTLPPEAILVMGNEANGVSENIEALTTKKLAIPRFGPIKAAESLNVAMATSILLSEFRRGL